MQGRRSGVATRFKDENSAAIAVHCCAHSLNLCLQDVGRKLLCVHDALETTKQISTLIFSKTITPFFNQVERVQ